MTLPAGRYKTIYYIRLVDDDVLVSDGLFEILYSRRCEGKLKERYPEDSSTTYGYGIAMDIFVAEGAVLKIIRDGEEWRRYE